MGAACAQVTARASGSARSLGRRPNGEADCRVGQQAEWRLQELARGGGGDVEVDALEGGPQAAAKASVSGGDLERERRTQWRRDGARLEGVVGAGCSGGGWRALGGEEEQGPGRGLVGGAHSQATVVALLCACAGER
jgi:hypothetical protein